MGKQLEVGTQFPMRPATVVLRNTSSVYNLVNTSPGDWNTNTKRITPATDQDMMNTDSAGNNPYVKPSGTSILLRKGIYKVTFEPVVLAAGAVATVTTAVTSQGTSGVTVYNTSSPCAIAAGTSISVPVTALVHVTADDTLTNAIALRAELTDDSSGTATASIAASSYVATIEKIGNANEA